MTSASAGLLILILAGVMNASFTLPMKYTRRWAWENTWLAWTIFALLLLPPLVACASVPHLAEVYRAASAHILTQVVLFGAGWGVSQILFGLAVDSIGIALTFSLVLGTSAAVGTIVPLVTLHRERLNTSAGHGILAGVAIVLLGVLICAVAGKRREDAQHAGSDPRKKATAGLALAILSGFGAAFINFGLAFGAPLVQSARLLGAGTLGSTTAVWVPLAAAGAVPNVLYCLWLMARGRTAARFPAGGIGHWGLAFIMAVCWFGSTMLYGVSTVLLGAWGPVLGWPVFMSLIVITASLLGMLTGEWKNSGAGPLRIQWAGVTMLVIAVFVLAGITRLQS